MSIDPAPKRRAASMGSRTHIMGVINVTPDSFSGDGMEGDHAAIRARALQLVDEGADWIDIGAESTRPGYTPISAESELGRLMPALTELDESVSVPISIDTTKAIVAEKALSSGAVLVNNVSGRVDLDLYAVVARARAGLVLTHNRPLNPGIDLVVQIQRDLEHQVIEARRSGVAEDTLWVDPGLGFSKGWEANFAVLRRLQELRCLGFPILIGPSRKGMIGKVLGSGTADRREGTAALVSIAIAHGADVVRVHDVRYMRRVARMIDALIR